MRYLIYTDGAGNGHANVIGCSYFIINNKKYINSDYRKYEGMSNPTQAETIAVGLAAGYMLNMTKPGKNDTVEFYIDCVSTIDFCNKYLKERPTGPCRTANSKVQLSIDLLRKLYSQTNVTLYKVTAHKSTLNPNSYVDKLAKLAIRR